MMHSTPSVYVIATLDTKGREADFVRHYLQQLGVPVTLVDASCQGEPQAVPDIPRQTVLQASYPQPTDAPPLEDRGASVQRMADAVQQLVLNAHRNHQLLGVLALGGSAGTTIGTAGMRCLPLGVPKIMVSTLAAGDVRAFVGTKDITMLHSVVDIAGVNRVSRLVLEQAAAMMAGSVHRPPSAKPANEAPVIAATMFGVTTPCVEHARKLLEQRGYEVLVFHATGSGGQTLESLIDEGWIAGVLDITTTELADLLCGGVLSAGPSRLTAAARHGIPQLVSVGATDMVNFWAPETIPAQFRSRKFHRHNDHVTLMRTTVDENRRLGEHLANCIRSAPGTTRVLLPSNGVSALDRSGQPFDDPAARQALFQAIRSHAGQVPVEEVPLHINDQAFAELAVERLLSLIHLPT